MIRPYENIIQDTGYLAFHPSRVVVWGGMGLQGTTQSGKHSLLSIVIGIPLGEEIVEEPPFDPSSRLDLY